jgi:catechol 2,3-dioxygenase-like lactoylglutathione lyase family enzyme
MSILFGGIRQMGMVVRDAEKAMHEWGKLGVGPFFTMPFTFDDFVYRGELSAAPEVTLCFAHSGPVQIELIQQHNNVPSGYTEFLQRGQIGMQHVAAWFEDHDSYDAKRQDLLDRGFIIVHEGSNRALDARFAYFETEEPGGLMFEIAEALLPAIRGNIDLMEQAARNWDGKQIIAA